MLNTVTLVGRLVQDPIIKEVSGGKNVCEVKLALTRPFKMFKVNMTLILLK